MNDTLSLLLATLVLATGGLGLYIYKDQRLDEKDGELEEVYNESTIFGLDEEEKTKPLDKLQEEEILEAHNVIVRPDKSKSTKIKKASTKHKRNSRNSGTKRNY
jgi:hypothetical protein